MYLNSEQCKKLLGLLNEFEDLFDGTPGKWDTVPMELDINPGYKLFNGRYHWVLIINKDIF